MNKLSWSIAALVCLVWTIFWALRIVAALTLFPIPLQTVLSSPAAQFAILGAYCTFASLVMTRQKE